MTKTTLRKELVASRAKLSTERRREAGIAFARQFQALHLPPARVGAYMAIGSELSIVDHITLPLALPRVEGDHIVYVPWAQGDPLHPGAYSVPEPTEEAVALPSVIFIPCLGGTHDGYRLGYGAGYFDRLLASASVISIGVMFREGLLADFPREPHDIPLTHMFVV